MYYEIGPCLKLKIYRHLVFKGSFYLWEINDNKIFNYTKIKHLLMFEIPWKLTTPTWSTVHLSFPCSSQKYCGSVHYFKDVFFLWTVVAGFSPSRLNEWINFHKLRFCITCFKNVNVNLCKFGAIERDAFFRFIPK